MRVSACMDVCVNCETLKAPFLRGNCALKSVSLFKKIFFFYLVREFKMVTATQILVISNKGIKYIWKLAEAIQLTSQRRTRIGKDLPVTTIISQ